MASWQFECDICGFEDFKVCGLDEREKPWPCSYVEESIAQLAYQLKRDLTPEEITVLELEPCSGTMRFEYMGNTPPMGKIIDQKLWPNGMGGMEIKKRRRVLGTDLGRIRLDKMSRSDIPTDQKPQS